MSLLERWVGTVEPLVCFESPSGDVERLEAMARRFATAFEARGATVETHSVPGVGDHLVARFGGPAPERGPLLVVGHLDTVHPVGTLERLPFQVEDDRIGGPGVYDMKGGLAALMVALDLMQERGVGLPDQLVVLVTCDEETGSDSSRGLIEELGRSARAALVLEPCVPGGGVKVGRKGVALYHLDVQGKPAHAGIEPEKGASAIHELAHQLVAVLEFADTAAETTLNAGRIVGGSGSNVVAEHANVQVDVRFWTRAEAERVDQAFRSLQVHDPSCSLEVRGGVNRYALEPTPESRRLLETAVAEAATLGFDLQHGRTGGASDGNLLGAVGCPTLDGLGPDGGGAHSMSEHVLAADVPRRIELLAALLRTL